MLRNDPCVEVAWVIVVAFHEVDLIDGKGELRCARRPQRSVELVELEGRGQKPDEVAHAAAVIDRQLVTRLAEKMTNGGIELGRDFLHRKESGIPRRIALLL